MSCFDQIQNHIYLRGLSPTSALVDYQLSSTLIKLDVQCRDLH